MKKQIACSSIVKISSPISDHRPRLLVLWCMPDNKLWSEYRESIPTNYAIIKHDIRKDPTPDMRNIGIVYISGSELSIASKESSPVEAFLKHLIADDQPPRKVAGTCFGAQALAKWMLNKSVFESYSPEKNKFREFKIDRKTYNGHVNHAWFIAADRSADWTILSQATHSLTDHMAKTTQRTCVDIFTAQVNQVSLFGSIPHPHMWPPTGNSIRPVLNEFFDTRLG